MDYTKVPRSLIYKEKSRDEFLKMSVLNKYLFEGMYEAFYYLEYDAEPKMVQALNNAYYLLTIILLDDRPHWRQKEYMAYARVFAPNIGGHDPLTLGILVLLMNRFGLNVQEKYARLYDSLMISHNLAPDHPIRMLVTKYVPDDCGLSLEDFAPRVIDEDAIRDFNKDVEMNWRDLTDDYDEAQIRELLKAVRNTEEGDMLIVRELIKDVEAFCDDSRKTKKLQMLNDLEESIYWQYNAEADEAFSQARIAEEEAEQERIRNIEEENKILKQQLAQLQGGMGNKAESSNNSQQDGVAEPEQKGLSRNQAVLFTHALAEFCKFSKKRKKDDIAPMVTGLFGWGTKSAYNSMTSGYSREERKAVAAIFDTTWPDFAIFVRDIFDKKHKKGSCATPQ